MGKIVILEGPDGGGKTTLAKLFEKGGWEYRHDGVPPPRRDNIAYYLEQLNYAMESSRDVVFDRFWLGERIYGPVARNSDSIGKEGERLFRRIHESKLILMYLCLPPLETVMANYEKKILDPNDYLKSSVLLMKVFNAYAMWAYENGTFESIWDYEKNSVVDILNDLESLKKSGRVPLPHGMVGSPQAKYLLIGDRPNHPTIDIPFHALTHSSRYLNQAITIAQIQEKDLALWNAYGTDIQIHDPDEIQKALPDLTDIVLMGREASRWFDHYGLKVFGYNVHMIPHPQFFRRFKSPFAGDYSKLILEALNGYSDKR